MFGKRRRWVLFLDADDVVGSDQILTNKIKNKNKNKIKMGAAKLKESVSSTNELDRARTAVKWPTDRLGPLAKNARFDWTGRGGGHACSESVESFGKTSGQRSEVWLFGH